ncbi:hypothetical protein GCM10011487_56700 [Steroidobacter agaridevorans]|uniref:Uncharacterized protein n=1 Tax=Steroidobacter agaridevorans TaxID=2695856 RepID=A0A829YKA0_9GAMM|nr:hypothetical protein [Steroidobacter agaridevorans]GFE83670.1 hypothetical protein GCM10011487_56700 [Steroidobacter agaridevorans]
MALIGLAIGWLVAEAVGLLRVNPPNLIMLYWIARALSLIIFAVGFVLILISFARLFLPKLRAKSGRRSGWFAGVHAFFCNPSPLGALRSLCDLVPGPALRALLITFVAEQERQVEDLTKQKRAYAANGARVVTWVLFVWYVAKGALFAITEVFSRQRPGSP